MPKLTFIGHAAFLLEDDAGNVVAIDPFIEDNPATDVAVKDLKPNTILLTHAHNDHVGDTVELAHNNDARVICIVELGDWLETQGVRDVVGANHGGTVAFPGGTVKFVPAWHSSTYSTREGMVAPGVPAGLVVRFGGRAFYFAGDTALFGDMRLIAEMHAPEIAFLPIGDHYTMGPDAAARAARMLGVRQVVPMHYGTFPVLTGTPDRLKALVDPHGIDVLVLKPGETAA
jgi:L-ascorbate metabolism protein UlaG (beta-lactamase superfamily)